MNNPYAPPGAETTPDDLHNAILSADPAGFAVRLGARLIDWLVSAGLGGITGLFSGVILAVVGGPGHVPHGPAKGLAGIGIGPLALGALASLLYHAVSEGLGGATAGKAILGLRVKSVGTYAPCGVWAGVQRSLAYYVDAFFFGMVAYETMKGSPLKQRIGDKWARTVVVRAASLPPEARGGLGVGLALGCAAHVVVSALTMAVKAF
jgi:uncharacterized RDD family membrane protein YckC